MEENVLEVSLGMIIYFSKINLATTDLFDVYKDSTILNEIKSSIISFIRSGVIYKTEDNVFDKDGQLHKISTKYKLTIGEKRTNAVSGVIYKETKLYYKKVNNDTDEIESHTIPTIEDIRFYYDVEHEIIGFHTRNRFGFREFNTAISQLLNSCMEENNLDFRFQADLCNEGMDINEIEAELKNIHNIKRLTFQFKAPNPADDDMLDDLQNGLNDTVEQMAAANANGMSVIFDSYGKVGLNVESEEIKKNIRRIGRIHSSIDDKTAIKNGYASVKAISRSGKIFTTEEQKPIKREIFKDLEFIDACKDTILSILTNKKG